MAEPEQKKALIVVRTYPTPAQKGVEVSCTAAITDAGKWLRLFPVPWRLLPTDQKFQKYQWVEVSITKASDPRPESYKLRQSGIKICSEVPPGRNWRARKETVYPLRSHCLCCLIRERKSKGFPTLGIFRPSKIDGLVIEAVKPNWTPAQLAKLRQKDLFATLPKTELEKIPFKFQYKFSCACSDCKGHTIACTDWEIGESWRKWSRIYGDGWEDKFRQRYEKDMIEKYDTHFYVGTMHAHPATWLIVGLFYPPKGPDGLFEYVASPIRRP